MFKKNLLLISTLIFSQLTFAQLNISANLDDNNGFDVEMDICYHGSIEEPFREIVRYVYPHQPCPSGENLPHSDELLKHFPGDPDCRVTRCSSNGFGCGHTQ